MRLWQKKERWRPPIYSPNIRLICFSNWGNICRWAQHQTDLKSVKKLEDVGDGSPVWKQAERCLWTVSLVHIDLKLTFKSKLRKALYQLHLFLFNMSINRKKTPTSALFDLYFMQINQSWHWWFSVVLHQKHKHNMTKSLFTPRVTSCLLVLRIHLQNHIYFRNRWDFLFHPRGFKNTHWRDEEGPRDESRNLEGRVQRNNELFRVNDGKCVPVRSPWPENSPRSR